MTTRTLSVSALLFCCAANAQHTHRWHDPAATHRTVFQLSTAFALNDPAVTLPPLLPPADGPVTLIDTQDAETPVAIHRGTNGIAFTLAGTLSPDAPRTVIAYTGGTRPSPLLGEPPPQRADYARNASGHAWDFDDGTPRGVTGWGDRPHHYGPVTVKDGWLQIPVKDSDPYFIFGNMFGQSPHPQDLAVNSAHYRTLELRLRQSCPHAQWEFFVTDTGGRHASVTFDVHGTHAQTFRFDLKAVLPDFWDGRTVRALRIDTTNNRRDILAEVDYVRILPVPPAVTAGPLFTRDAVAARDTVTAVGATLPRTATAGAPVQARLRATGTPPDAPLLWALATPEHGTRTFARPASSASLPPFTRAGETLWTLGLADDLGQPIRPVSGTLRVQPAALAAYRLTPARAYIDLASPRATLSVQGLDAFGNALPVDIKAPAWRLPPGATAPAARLRGNPATVTLTLPADAPATHAVRLADAKSIGGETALATVAYRRDTIRLNPNGYLVHPDGSLYFPNGGLYANWPHRLHADGTATQALDLFPCGPNPYRQGFPWPAATEDAVKAYLAHCAANGVTCLRLMLRNMDLVGRVDPVQLQATLHLFDLARPHGIRFNVALFEDYDKPPYVSPAILEKIVLPHYTPAQLAALPPHRARFLARKETLPSAALRYSDPDARACQKDYLRELIPVLAAREEVLCYEFENEMVHPPMEWCADIAAFIRAIDPRTLILGNPGPHHWPESLRWRDAGCDLYSYHPYTDGYPDADHGAFIHLVSKWSAQSRLPMYTGEGGINQNRWQNNVKKVSPEQMARGARDLIWMSVCCGANGSLYWTLMHDLEAREYAKVLPAFAALGFDLAAVRRQTPPVALLYPAQRRPARDAATAMRLLDLGVDFDTVATNEAAAYPVRIDPASQPPESLDLPPTVAAPAKGWQAATLLCSQSGQALLYLRNVAGGVRDFGAPPRPCHLRDVQPAEAAFTLRGTWARVTVYDLDTREARTVTPDAAGRVTLGVTAHDFLVALRK